MSKLSIRTAIVTLAAALFLPTQTIAQNENDQLTHEIVQELIEIDTSQNGRTTVAAEAMAARLRNSERIGVRKLYEGREFLYRLVKELGSN